MTQAALIRPSTHPQLSRFQFSHESFAPEEARLALEKEYAEYLRPAKTFNRRQVSFQGNKQALIHSWIRYKEGFSEQLVTKLIDDFGLQPGATILEPFSGSATSLLVAKSKGIDAIGFEILPNCQLIWEAKKRVFSYSLPELRWISHVVKTAEIPNSEFSFPHLTITKGAFSPQTEREIMYFSSLFEDLLISGEARILVKLIITSVLEEVSYTRKDGQYLRWDSRSPKIVDINSQRKQAGKQVVRGMDKGALPNFKDAFLARLTSICEDIAIVQKDISLPGQQELISDSVLYALPGFPAETFDAVITSPPYCNRYDYTRSYALELAYLGVDEKGIKDLRQELLSCTVENKVKTEKIKALYSSIGRLDDFYNIMAVIEAEPVLAEVEHALQARWLKGDINNKGILRMVKGYFIDLGFVIAEMFRTCKRGAYVAVINDNVRYGGEVIPVDLVSTRLAREFGFTPVAVEVLPQQKGNSSQQMKKFGREPLRKSVTIWRK